MANYDAILLLVLSRTGLCACLLLRQGGIFPARLTRQHCAGVLAYYVIAVWIGIETGAEPVVCVCGS